MHGSNSETHAGGEITTDRDVPEGRQVPQNGFGDVWSKSNSIQLSFGWATAPEQGYSGQFQAGFSDAGDVTYFSTPDGRVIRFVANRSGSYTWSNVG